MATESAREREPLSLSTPVRLMRQMAHDMRGSLGALTGTSDMFAEGVYGQLTPQQTRAIDRIRRNSHRLLALLDDLMVYVKAEAGEYPLNPAAFAPRGTLAAVCQQIKPTAEAKGLQVRLDVETSVPEQLLGDEAAISRILLAVLWNAVGFTSQGSIWIESAWATDGYWRIDIRDTGPGIAREDVPHIFEPFWRGEVRPQMPTSGYGLGLAMAQALAALLGGKLFVQQTGVTGSTFRLQLALQVA
jgi:two-component system sensor histidine kinase/response regulator